MIHYLYVNQGKATQHWAMVMNWKMLLYADDELKRSTMLEF